MTVYFAFNDECGDYAKTRSERFIRSHPYYVTASHLMDGEEWKRLNAQFARIKTKHRFPLGREIKWSYLWSIKKHYENNETIPENRPYSFLAGFALEDLLAFASDTLSLTSEFGYLRIVITVTDNSRCPAISENALYKFHLQEIMQRIEMELQSDPLNLCVIFVDPNSREKDQLLRDAYSEIATEGDFISEYSHIKDSLNSEFSHHSVGIQLSDYIAGSFNGFLRNFQESTALFRQFVLPHLRKGDDEEILGYGIREVPRNEEFRKALQDRIRSSQMS